MGMKPTEFFDSFVLGNSDDCHANPRCVRRAFNAAVAASHLADHYLEFNLRHNPKLVAGFLTIGPFVAHISTCTKGAFKDIRSIANAYKHLYTDSNTGVSAHSTVNSSGAIESVELPGSEDLTYIAEEYSAGPTPDSGKFSVVFTRRDGSRSEFLPVLQATIAYWHTKIYRGGA